MGKIIASYLVKVTVREPEGTQAEAAKAAGLDAPAAPTNDALAYLVEMAVHAATGADVSATSERTDQ